MALLPGEIAGLPAHALVVHATVVLVPLTALLVALTACSSTLARRVGLVAPSLAVLALLLVLATVDAGEWLVRRVPETPLVVRHEALGQQVVPWVAGLAAVAVVVWLLARQRGRDVLLRVFGLVAVVLALGALFSVYRAGESGARAVWEGSYSSEPTERRTR